MALWQILWCGMPQGVIFFNSTKIQVFPFGSAQGTKIMTKDQLIQLFQEKDRMRKRGLYELFKAEIETKTFRPLPLGLMKQRKTFSSEMNSALVSLTESKPS